MGCLAKDREHRPKDAQLVEIALAEYLRYRAVGSPEAVLAELLAGLFGEELDEPGGTTLSAYRQSLHSAELDGVETTDVRGDTSATIVFTR